MAGRRSNKKIVEDAVEDGVVTWSDIVKLIEIITLAATR